MKVRFFGEYHKLSKFLIDIDYPYEWDTGQFQNCLVTIIKTDADETVGYVWFEWAVIENVLEFHIAIDPRFQRKWLTRGVMEDYRKIAVFTGAKAIIALTPFPAAQRMLAKAGWKLSGPYSYYRLTENWCTNETQDTQDRKAGPRTGPAASPGSSGSGSGSSD